MTIELKRKRLYKLQRQAAIGGAFVDPAISIQIEDLRKEIETMSKDIDNQQQLLEIHRRNLKLQLSQADMHTSANVPPFIIHGIDEARQNIQQIKQLLRNYGVDVADLDIDEAPTQKTRLDVLTPIVMLSIPSETYEDIQMIIKRRMNIDLDNYIVSE